MAASYACEVKLFNKWSYDDISVGDISLEDYIAVKPKFAQFVPHTAGRFQAKRFKKAQCPIVERMTCSLMMHGRNNGKKIMAVRIVQHAFDIVNLLTDTNPIVLKRLHLLKIRRKVGGEVNAPGSFKAWDVQR